MSIQRDRTDPNLSISIATARAAHRRRIANAPRVHIGLGHRVRSNHDTGRPRGHRLTKNELRDEYWVGDDYIVPQHRVSRISQRYRIGQDIAQHHRRPCAVIRQNLCQCLFLSTIAVDLTNRIPVIHNAIQIVIHPIADFWSRGRV